MKDNRVIGADSFLVRLGRELGILAFISARWTSDKVAVFFSCGHKLG